MHFRFTIYDLRFTNITVRAINNEHPKNLTNIASLWDFNKLGLFLFYRYRVPAGTVLGGQGIGRMQIAKFYKALKGRYLNNRGGIPR
jgi:hypothetical protein